MRDANVAVAGPIQNAGWIGGKVLRVALGTLFLTASSWVAVPTVPVPITMQTYAVIVVGAVFGARLGAITVLAWLTEAAIGLPVLAQGASGLAVFLGPTAGYLFSFPLAAGFVGWVLDRRSHHGIVRSFVAMLAGNAINLALGVFWLSAAIGWRRALVVGFLPFWIGGIVKAVLATATVLLFRHSMRERFSAGSQ